MVVVQMGLDAFKHSNNEKQTDSDNGMGRTESGRENSEEKGGTVLLREVGRDKYIDILMLFRHYNKDGEYMGPDPPPKHEVIPLTEDMWDDRWVDMTGEFEYSDSRPVKYVEKCHECGARRPWTGKRSRFVRCYECGLVMMDKDWRDDRFKKESSKQKGIDSWTE